MHTMQYKNLSNTDIKVSELCLGTMTWGEQNSEAEAHEQLDYALEQGVNFIDTAEMYPVPPLEATQGRTESYIGTWLAQRNCRDKVVIATKVAGKAENWLPYLRGGTNLTRPQIEQAIDDSLKRLQTDYVDLYQLHWPDRKTNFFGQLGYTHDDEDESTPLLETLEVLSDLVKAGKIRQIGVSNETPWGVMQFVHLAETQQLPRMVSIQNPYNLLNRTFEVGLAEIAHREQVGLLAYSPLAFGALTGKYLNNARPEKARMTLYKRFNRYLGDKAETAIQSYVELAQQHDLNPTQMALAYVRSRSFVNSTILGATSLMQLKTNIASAELDLSKEVLAGIEAIHQADTNPCP